MRRALLSLLALLLLAVAAGSAAPASAAGGVFDDVTATTPFAADIEWLAAEGITDASAQFFRPNGAVTRQAMAVFLYKFANPGVPVPPCTADAYPDVPEESPYCGSIRWLAEAGITSGTASGGFAPLAPVTRQSMAAFLYKLQHDGAAPPECTKSPYSDVAATSPFCGSIDWLYATGVTTGALRGTFDPSGTCHARDDGRVPAPLPRGPHRRRSASTSPTRSAASRCRPSAPSASSASTRASRGPGTPCMATS